MDNADYTPASTLPPVNRDRVIEQLAADGIIASGHSDDDNVAVVFFNDLDWMFTSADGLVRVECALPTELGFDDAGPALRVLANVINAEAFDGRALVGNVDVRVELRGDASFVATPGMEDAQLFTALNFAIVAAQEALLGTLDAFNEMVRELD